MKKSMVLCLIICFIISFPSYALDNEILYHGYSEDITENMTNKSYSTTGLRIKDSGDNKGSIAYYYDNDGDNPGGEKDKSKSYYHQIINYIEKNDDYINKYGIDKKKKLSALLAGAYPVDIDNVYIKYKNKITEAEARYVTQSLITDFTNNTDIDKKMNNKFDKRFTRDMRKYYKSLFNKYIRDFKEDYSQKAEEPYIRGDMSLKREYTDYGIIWRTGNLRVVNIPDKKEYVQLQDLKGNMKIMDSESGKELNGNTINKNDRFYIQFYEKADGYRIGLEWKVQDVEIYLYEFKKGDKNTRNLIRANADENTGIKYYYLKPDNEIKDEKSKISINIKKEKIRDKEEDILVNLLANERTIGTSLLNNENKWNYTFRNLDKKSDGEDIQYSAEAKSISGEIRYKIDGNAEDGFIVSDDTISEYDESEISGLEDDNYESDDEMDGYEENDDINYTDDENSDSNDSVVKSSAGENITSSPKTGDNGLIGLYGILFLSSSAAVIYIFRYKKRY